MNDQEFRRLLAKDLVLVLQMEHGLKVWMCEQECPDCRMPLIEYEAQAIAYCWYCAADKRAAQSAKTKLLRAKMDMKYRKPGPNDPVSPFTFGMPL